MRRWFQRKAAAPAPQAPVPQVPARGVTIDSLLLHAPAQAARAERHLWLIDVLSWVRRGEPVSGMQYVLRYLDAHPVARTRVVSLLATCLADLNISSLLADNGFAPRAALFNELGERLRHRMLPASPDTRDLATLFGLLFNVEKDQAWVGALDASTLDLLGKLLHEAWTRSGDPRGWRAPFMNGLSILASQVRASGLSPQLRLRLGEGDGVTQPFHHLARAAEDLHDLLDAAWLDSDATEAAGGEAVLAPPPVETPQRAALLQQAHYLRALLDRCVQLAQGVHEHLEAYGVSVDVVFEIDQLRARCLRIEQVLDCLLSPRPHREVQALVLALIQGGAERRSVRALFKQHYSLLARIVAERSAETGEHYITRTRAQYMDMLRRAAGGGVIISGTTFLKFFLLSLGLSAFWSGFAAGANYALSFVIIHLLHWTIATKQPAMTAPAMAAKLRDTHTDEGVEGFVDEVANLIRSQTAGIVGNLALVVPVVLGIQALAWWGLGKPLVSVQDAQHSLEKLTLLGPSLFYAAFAGVLLFSASLVAGWFENWFVWHRLDSALQWNPRIRRWLGPVRAEHWANWWRANISGLAANVSLGFMLGLTPSIAGFFGLPLDVRHVTLSTGQVVAALGTLGWPLLYEASFWWCVAAIPLTGLLNVGVSFAFALRVAIRSRGVRVKDRSRLWRAMGRRLLRKPWTFLWPPKHVPPAEAARDTGSASVPPPPHS